MKFLAFRQTKLGSSFDITRARVGGASVIPLLSSLLFSVPPSRRKVLGAKPKQAGKKEGGWGEGIFARLLPFPFRLRKEKAEGGFGGNSAFSLRNQIVDSPAVLLVQSRTPHKSFLFLLEEKNRRAQIKKCEENFFAGWRGFRATAGLASLLGVLLKKCSNFVQKTPPIFTFARNGRSERVTKRHTMPFLRYAPRFFQGQRKRAVAHEVVRLSKAQSKTKVLQPIFLFALSSDVKRFLISIARKLTFQYE